MTKDKVTEDEGAVRDRTTKYTEVLIGLMEDGSVFFLWIRIRRAGGHSYSVKLYTYMLSVKD